MEKTFARIFSFIFHPLLVPAYFLLVLYKIPVYYFTLNIPAKVKGMTLLFVFLMTFVIPVLIVTGMRMLNLIKNLEMTRRQDRWMPMMITTLFFYLTYYSLKQLSVFYPAMLFMLGATILVLIGIVLNYFYKISQHMIAWGGFTGAITALSISWHTPLYFWLFGVIFISGLTGFSRIKLKMHTAFEVYSGWLLGAIVMTFLFLTL